MINYLFICFCYFFLFFVIFSLWNEKLLCFLGKDAPWENRVINLALSFEHTHMFDQQTHQTHMRILFDPSHVILHVDHKKTVVNQCRVNERK